MYISLIYNKRESRLPSFYYQGLNTLNIWTRQLIFNNESIPVKRIEITRSDSPIIIKPKAIRPTPGKEYRLGGLDIQPKYMK
jgi:hypothetical protein